MAPFKPPHEVDSSGYPMDPVLRNLQKKLGHLAATWRGMQNTPDAQAEIVKEYCSVMSKLYSMGWDDILDADAELPEELLPAEYKKRHPPMKSNNWWLKSD